MRRAAPCLILVLLLACGGPARDPSGPGAPDGAAQARFETLASSLFEAHWKFRPHLAAVKGYHQYDGQLANVAEAGLRAEIERLTAARRQLESVDPAVLSSSAYLEHAVLLTEVRKELFDLQTLERPWRNPMWYMDPLDLAPYVSREYASLDVRARAMGRLGLAAGPFLAAAAENLQQAIPRTWLDTSLMQVNGMIEFARGDVRAATFDRWKAEGTDGGEAARELEAGLAAYVAALESFRNVLEARRPHVTDDFALGEARFLEMLRDNEGISMTLPALQEMATKDLDRNLAVLAEEARRIDPKASTDEVVARVGLDRPKPSEVLAVARAQAEQARVFLVEKDLVTVPDGVIDIRESPPFMRWNSAFLSEAGPFETASLPSFYYISPPEPTWPAEEQAAYIFPRGVLLSTTVHEVWPGHFLQALHQKANRSPILKAFCTYSMSEGWAHYAEEMMWEEGFGGGDPALHMGQLSDALLRNVRFVSALGLHTGTMTVPESTALFATKGLQDPASARQQAVRGTFDPGYLNYTLGKLLIIELREDVKARRGDAFTLKAFHDEFLSYGCAPIPAIAHVMLRDGPAR